MLDTPVDAPTRPPLIVIAGPTASGKSAAAMCLADRFPIEIVNADARAFYRGMDIGTAKPSRDDRERVPHHLVDMLDPRDPMSLATFQDMAMKAIADIHGRSMLPVLVGGTPQYVNAVVENWTVPRVAPNQAFRTALEREVERNGVQPLLARLRAVDPVAVDQIGPNPRRLVRALEVFDATGVPITAQQGVGPPPYDALEIQLFLERARLYDRIDRRVDAMIDAGLVDEVRALLDAGVPPEAPALSAIGYRQVIPVVEREAPLGHAIERIKFDSHRLVRRQQAWFRRNPRMIRIDVGTAGHPQRIADLVSRHSAGWLRSVGAASRTARRPECTS